MGLDLCYRAGDRQVAVKFSMADWEVMVQLSLDRPDLMKEILGTEELGEAVEIDRLLLLRHVVELLELIEADPSILPVRYQFQARMLELGGLLIKYGARGLGGIRMEGDSEHAYGIMCGVNKLELTKFRVNPDGSGDEVEKRDLRGESELQTDNYGLIKFRTKRTSSRLREGLEELRAFLESVDTPHVEKLVG
ncbi:MAG: hypothetical protein AAGK09_02680 [Planctomycetota bacterium]